MTVLVTCCEGSPDEIELFTDANAGSTVEVQFSFDVVDSYEPSASRLTVTSTSDPAGESTTISEVVGETNDAPSPTSGILSGDVLLSASQSALALGDGAVWVQDGDALTVAYYEADGTTIIDSHTISVDVPAATATPTPTPIPTAGPSALLGLFLALVGMLIWRLSRKLPARVYRKADVS